MDFLIILLAGWGAGVVTGLVGASAIVIVTPVLIAFLGYNPYTAIGISLATDVFASSVSAATYKKHDNIDLKNGIAIAVTAVLAAIVGSVLSGKMNATTLGSMSGIIILFMGISFMQKPLDERVKDFKEKVDLTFFQQRKYLSSTIAGVFIGTMTGFFGAGGGVMILITLTFILEYKIHIAVGTSVLIMVFTALSGSLSHFAVEAHIPLIELTMAGIGGIIGAYMAAKYANLISEKRLSKMIGIVFILLAGMVFLKQILI